MRRERWVHHEDPATAQVVPLELKDGGVTFAIRYPSGVYHGQEWISDNEKRYDCWNLQETARRFLERARIRWARKQEAKKAQGVLQ